MRCIFAGATSPTGNAVAKRLAEKIGPENIVCIARSTSDTSLLQSLGFRIHIGDVTEPDSFSGILNASTVYLDMTHPKHYHKSLEAIMSAGVERAYFVTTTGIFSKYRRCADIYIENEERIRNSGLTYTILRPSMIYGTLRDRNMSKLIKLLDNYPLFPLFGEGDNLMQPVFTDDLADGIVAAIDNPRSENNDYNLAGPQPITYSALIEMIVAELNRNVRMVRINPALAQRLVQMAQWIPGFPINSEQVLRMREDKAFEISKAVADLGFSPMPFKEGITREINDMRMAKLLR